MKMTEQDARVCAWFRAWLAWDALPPAEQAVTPEPAFPEGASV